MLLIAFVAQRLDPAHIGVADSGHLECFVDEPNVLGAMPPPNAGMLKAPAADTATMAANKARLIMRSPVI